MCLWRYESLAIPQESGNATVASCCGERHALSPAQLNEVAGSDVPLAGMRSLVKGSSFAKAQE